MQPSGEAPEPQDAPVRTNNRRLIIAMLLYAGLAIGAAVQLSGRPRLVVWLLLGLFAIKTLLTVLRQKND